MKATLRRVGAWSLIVLGIAGCVLPIIPGIPILAAGVAMLGTDHWLVRRCSDWLRRKGIWPRPGSKDDLSNAQRGTSNDGTPGGGN